MSGTKEGARKAAATTKERHGEDFYARNALKAQKAWDKNGRKPRGFKYDPEVARLAGRKGGKNRWAK